MNSFDIRNYWLSKYEDKFNKSYASEKPLIELGMLKRLLNKYSPYLLLEAIDMFLSDIKEEKASIILFASNKFFNSYFEELIKEKDIVKYQRMISWYSKDNQTLIRSLIQEYKNFVYAISLYPEDREYMSLTLEKLKNIPME